MDFVVISEQTVSRVTRHDSPREFSSEIMTKLDNLLIILSLSPNILPTESDVKISSEIIPK